MVVGTVGRARLFEIPIHIDFVSDPDDKETEIGQEQPLSRPEQLCLELDQARNREFRPCADLENFRASV